MNNALNELKIEDYIWIIFIALSVFNMIGDTLQKEYVNTKDPEYQKKANNIFTFTLLSTLFIYTYFFKRNYEALENISEERKKLFQINTLGTAFLIIGILCLLYFQVNNKNFIGTPSI